MSAARQLPGLLPALFLLAALAGCGGVATKAPDGGDGPATCSPTPGSAKANGQTCACAADCQSGFCADGVCCNSSCGETCKTCNAPGSPGVCSFVPMGGAPRAPSMCPAAEATSCGLDGTCNGAGACRKHRAGTVCAPGSCDGASVTGVEVCDGDGRCRPGPATVCAPFGCEAKKGQCFATCSSDSDCAGGVKCVAGSCGPKPRGAVCKVNGDCASGFCADGVCCNVACKGSCVSCSQLGRAGTCSPVEAGAADPRQLCKDEGVASCGMTGVCDGFGACARYAAETICVPPACAGERLETPGTCDGRGVCRAPGVQNCWPYRCKGTACATKCTIDDDCQPGHACVAGSCGLKPPGHTCAAASECESNFCVDGVCCAEACAGACKSCALPSSMGRCAAIPAGAADPRGTCADQGAASCGTDGLCDGAGSCRVYKPGTECKAERCEANVYTPASTCNSTGQCAQATSFPCAPYACNGARCFSICGSNADCVAPNTCDAQNSCGKKGNGSFCSDATECASGTCAQGVCCASACAGACKSCAMAGTMGQCTNVATGAPDPSGTCAVQLAMTCGTNGMCEAGACQKYAQGESCGDATCPAGGATFTAASKCDGAGTCVTFAATSCAPYKCGTAACKAACTADADCAAPNTCVAGSCGRKPPGAACGGGDECTDGNCAQGVCCRTACAGACTSCALTGTEGTCAPVPAGGTDPAGTCTDAGAASCGTTGVCDGSGACQRYAAGTICAAPACPANGSTLTLARTCDGAGTCRAASTLSCAPFACNGTACNTTCTGNAACEAPNICDLATNLCGDKKPLGQSCAQTSDCLTGSFCVDGVCCATGSCGTCSACNVPGSAGTCAPVPKGSAEPHTLCATTAAASCGTNGLCDGAGKCAFHAVGTNCGAAACKGKQNLASAPTCDGAGVCAPGLMISCSPYACVDAACGAAPCEGDDDCAPGKSCNTGTGTCG